MAFTYEELHGKTVGQLRDIAENLGDHPALHGFSTKHKDELLSILCNVMEIEAHVHHEIVGIDKKKIKAEITQLKAERDSALSSGDRIAYKKALRGIHHRKGELRRHTI